MELRPLWRPVHTGIAANRRQYATIDYPAELATTYVSVTTTSESMISVDVTTASGSMLRRPQGLFSTCTVGAFALAVSVSLRRQQQRTNLLLDALAN